MQFLKNTVNEKKQEIDYLTKLRDNIKIINRLEKENKELARYAFNSVVRKSIDTNIVHINCPHRNVRKISEGESYRLTSELGQDPHRETSYSVFRIQCKDCGAGVNDYLSTDSEEYYFTCDEARVVNNLARQYNIQGSIHTATRVRD